MVLLNFSPRTLPAFTCLSVFQCRCHSRLPDVNYGLPGKGKSKKRFSKLENIHIKGEVLFGLHPIISSLQAQRRQKFHQLFIDKNLRIGDSVATVCDLCERLQIKVTSVPRGHLDCLAGNRPHQGVCLDTDPLRLPVWSEENKFPLFDRHKPPVWILLYNIQDPMNFGAILRSAFFLGVERVLFPAKNSCRPNPVVSKASAGAMELVELVSVSQALTSLCQWWTLHGGTVLATGSGDDGSSEQMSRSPISTPLHKVKVTTPTLVLFGNEGVGLSESLVQHCHRIVSIPQTSHTTGTTTGHCGSLNVSVAAGIILHWIKYSSTAVD